MTDPIAQYQRPTTLLQAVNLVLAAAGQVPVASLDTANMNAPAEMALNRIGEVLTETLEEGWHFNTLEAFTLAMNDEGQVLLPSNCVRFVQGYFGRGWDLDLVQHGDKLFDRRTGSYYIGTPVVGNLTLLYPFEQCPTPCRWYVACRAARRHAAGTLVSGTVVQFTQADENQARLRWEQADADTAGRNLGDNPHIRRMRRRHAMWNTSAAGQITPD